MGWTYNAPDDTVTHGPVVTAVILAFTIFTFVIVCIRMYVRIGLVKAVGTDDWIIVVAWLAMFGQSVASILQTRWGLGLTSLADMPPENVHTFGLIQYSSASFYVIGIWGFKMSLLFAYLRFIPMPRYRAVIIGVMVFITIGHFSSVIGFYIMCTPFEENWGPGGAEGSCASRTGFYLTFSALTVVWDVLVFVLPIPVLAKTNMKIQRKAALICLFLLGIFVTVVQVVRIHAISQLTSYVDAWLPILWSIVEGYVGILVASVPTLAPLVRCMAERTRSGTASNRSGTGRSKVPYELHNLQGTKLSNGVRTHVEEESDDSPTAGAGLGSRTRTAGFADSTEHIL